MVEGVRRARGDTLQNGAETIENIYCGHTQHLISLSAQIAVTALVAGRIVSAVMTFAVDLDHQASFANAEIHDVRSDRVLPPNFETKLRSAQLLPQHYFRQGHRTSKVASSIDRRFAKRRAPSTIPSSRNGPPPRPGEDHFSFSIHAAQAPLARSRTRPI